LLEPELRLIVLTKGQAEYKHPLIKEQAQHLDDSSMLTDHPKEPPLLMERGTNTTRGTPDFPGQKGSGLLDQKEDIQEDTWMTKTFQQKKTLQSNRKPLNHPPSPSLMTTSIQTWQARK
jgi:hypothetical protein